jgi:hypothetical protein
MQNSHACAHWSDEEADNAHTVTNNKSPSKEDTKFLSPRLILVQDEYILMSTIPKKYNSVCLRKNENERRSEEFIFYLGGFLRMNCELDARRRTCT